MAKSSELEGNGNSAVSCCTHLEVAAMFTVGSMFTIPRAFVHNPRRTVAVLTNPRLVAQAYSEFYRNIRSK